MSVERKRNKKVRNLKKRAVSLVLLCTVISMVFTGCGTKEKEDDKPYYYNEANRERYEAYHKENPDLSEDEVIWRVEADIDKDDYEDITVISKEDENNDLLLINKHFRLRDGFKPKDLVDTGNSQLATKKTTAAYKKMAKAAKAEGLTLNIRSGYRSLATQKEYYTRYKNAYGAKKANLYSAKPGSSEHHTGRALDLVAEDWSFENFYKTDSCKWVHKNAWKYGFIVRYGKDITDVTGYAYESWHVTYVGEDVSKTMHDEGIKTLEEYWVKYVKYDPDDAVSSASE